MDNKLEIFKKKLIYRAGYRGTKEMDILLSAFVNKYINTFDETLLIELEKFLNFEDEVILDFYNNNNVMKKISKKTKYPQSSEVLNFNGGEVGFEPTNELPRCWFSRPVLSTAQPPLLEVNLVSLILSKEVK